MSKVVLQPGTSLVRAAEMTGLRVDELRVLAGLTAGQSDIVDRIEVAVPRGPLPSGISTPPGQSVAIAYHLATPNIVSAGVMRASDVPWFDFVEGIRVRELCNRANIGAGSVAEVLVAPGTTTAPHRLKGALEFQLVLSGNGDWQIDGGEKLRAAPGDVVFIPKNAVQSVTNIGRQPLRFVCFCTPRFDAEKVYEHMGDPTVAPIRAEVGLDGVVAIVPRFGATKSTRHKGKIAVVTGANGGLGIETCRQLGHQGFTVVLATRDPQKGEGLLAELAKEGIVALTHPLDVTSKESIDAFGRFIEGNGGRVDVLVNNAGICLELANQPPLEAGEVFARTMATNCQGPLMLTQRLLPLLRESTSPRVINITSELATTGFNIEGFEAYRASKVALNLFTQQMAKRGLVANAVDRGWVQTAMGGLNAPDTTNDGVQATLYLATCEDPPRGTLVRRSKGLEVPNGSVAIERSDW